MKHILRLVNYCKSTITSTQPTFLPWRFGLYQRPSSEEVCSIPPPVLATIVMRRGKKSVVRVAQRVATLIPIQGLPSFFPNMYCLFDPSSTFVGFSVQNSDATWQEIGCTCGSACSSPRPASRTAVLLSAYFLLQKYVWGCYCVDI